MEPCGRRITVLVADDDHDDCILIRDAFDENRLAADLYFVEDGEYLMDYLHSCNRSRRSAGDSPCPDLILLDLNMPRKDGREALLEIKSDPELARIPIVVLTTSKDEEDIIRSYNLGANSFISKPVSFEELVLAIQVLSRYWFEIVRLPPRESEDFDEPA